MSEIGNTQNATKSPVSGSRGRSTVIGTPPFFVTALCTPAKKGGKSSAISKNGLILRYKRSAA
jgi:hypothetical protein